MVEDMAVHSYQAFGIPELSIRLTGAPLLRAIVSKE